MRQPRRTDMALIEHQISEHLIAAPKHLQLQTVRIVRPAAHAGRRVRRQPLRLINTHHGLLAPGQPRHRVPTRDRRY
ncbi:hypothetical protein I549_0571 [Mycobacterium avium subsp. avium 2285 (R)]|nr:hypothetical protein I549_0571 [Mycobacterium avium subsp. avium 2285 (R)]